MWAVYNYSNVICAIFRDKQDAKNYASEHDLGWGLSRGKQVGEIY